MSRAWCWCLMAFHCPAFRQHLMEMWGMWASHCCWAHYSRLADISADEKKKPIRVGIIFTLSELKTIERTVDKSSITICGMMSTDQNQSSVSGFICYWLPHAWWEEHMLDQRCQLLWIRCIFYGHRGKTWIYGQVNNNTIFFSSCA